MSYIRCTSNPDNLYVWGDCQDIIHWWPGVEVYHEMPGRVFRGLMKAYYRRGGTEDEPIEFENARIYESSDDWKVVVEYNGLKAWQIRLWPVTFDYVHQNWLRQDYSVQYHLDELWRIVRYHARNARYKCEDAFLKYVLCKDLP